MLAAEEKVKRREIVAGCQQVSVLTRCGATIEVADLVYA
jgi:hypothetical protein